VAFFILQSAAAWAGIVPARLEDYPGDFTICHIFHDIGRSLSLPEFLGHEPHRAINMSKEFFIACTEIIHPRLALRRPDKTVLWAFSVAGE
jgi:hypothetical protein